MKQESGDFPYPILNTVYKKLRLAGNVCDIAVPTAVGIDPQINRYIRSVSLELKDVERHWRKF